MGVYHFMGLGGSIGTVTCAVDYIERTLDQINNKSASPETYALFRGSGGIRHCEIDKGKIEALVLFTSKEVIARQFKASAYSGNQSPSSVREELVKTLRKVWNRGDKDEGRKIFWCEVDIDNYQDCFEKVVKVAYRFSNPNSQGKEIWCNLTGGTNSVNAALLSMAQLTGKSTKQYLLSQRKNFRQEIIVPISIKPCPNKDGYFNTLPFLKTYIDTIGFYEILMELEAVSHPISNEDLLSRLKKKPQFNFLNLKDLKVRYMLKLNGLGYSIYDQDQGISEITDLGRQFIEELDSLEVLLCFEEKLLDQTIDIVQESKTWSWFTEVDVV